MDNVAYTRQLLDHLETLLERGTRGNEDTQCGYTLALSDVTAWVLKQQVRDVTTTLGGIREAN